LPSFSSSELLSSTESRKHTVSSKN